MDRIVEHFRRIACLDEFAVLEEFAADGIEAGNGERLAVNGRAVNDAAADGAVGNHQVFVERREPSFKAGVRNFNAAGDGDVFKKFFVAHAARQIHLGDHREFNLNERFVHVVKFERAGRCKDMRLGLFAKERFGGAEHILRRFARE